MLSYKCKHGVFTAFTHILLLQEKGLVTCITLHPEIMFPWCHQVFRCHWIFSFSFTLLHSVVLLTFPSLALFVYLENKLAENNRKKSKRGQCASSLANLEIYGSLKARWGEGRRSWRGAREKKGGEHKNERKNSVFWNFSVFPLKYRMFSESCATWWIAKKSENRPLISQLV